MNEQIYIESWGIILFNVAGIYKDYIILSEVELYLKQSNNIRNFDGNQTTFEFTKYVSWILSSENQNHALLRNIMIGITYHSFFIFVIVSIMAMTCLSLFLG